MGKRIVRRGSTQLRAELELVEALEPIEEAHAEAKTAYRAALDSGDQAAIAAAKRVKLAAAHHLNETRTWLRRERAITKLSTVTIPELERVLAGPILISDGKGEAGEDSEQRSELEQALAAAREELAAFQVEAGQMRRDLEALGGVVSAEAVPLDLPPGSADVTTSAITVKPLANGDGKGR